MQILQSIEPPLEQKVDFWGAQQVAASINPWRKKNAPAVQPKDLIPEWWKAAKPDRTNAEWAAMFAGLNTMLGGKVAGETVALPPANTSGTFFPGHVDDKGG